MSGAVAVEMFRDHQKMVGLGAVGNHKCGTKEGEIVNFEMLKEQQEMVEYALAAALNQQKTKLKEHQEMILV
jgi:hypothetical protein